ncbi:hypothetical protein PILCRDRAFT_237806 [Piloderma croceum F 1598]|uniref:Tubulin-specific chaperone A n=1 Tax=Piloderma croceum (strain F 1598) TaxID=765440 RepID=A0A0C3BQG9_PILCF|nr:hypothetical protein PILCRDRAFT_237806 [Piloderma croceum F 1598]
MSDPASIRRQLKIKTGVATRLLKEGKMYQQEAQDQQRKLDKLSAEMTEEWDVKNATRMMEEADRMIKDSSQRIGNALEDLKAIVLSAKLALGENPDLLNAEKALMEAEKGLDVAIV